MPERTVTIVNRKGLHARSAAKLVALTREYNCAVELRLPEKNADCASMMALMMLAAGLGTEICVYTNGEDSEAALDAVCALIESGFEESEED